LSPFVVSAKQWPAIGLIGGGNALDGIDTSTGVNDGDIALVWNDSGTAGWCLTYHFISGDSTAENSPLIIAPDTGTGRWHLSKESYKQVTFVIENPGSSENFGAFRFEHAGTIFKVIGVLRGSNTPSVTIQPQHGSNKTLGTNLFSSAQAVTSTTTGDVDTSGWNGSHFGKRG